MNSTHILIAALLACAFSPAMAHAGAALRLHATVADMGAEDTGGPSAASAEMARPPFDGAMPMHATSIKNAPYSAELVTEQQHNLADGNQIINKRSTMSYRDSVGRTRHEIRDADGTLRRVTINDAVEGATYILNPEAKIATKIGAHRHMSGAGRGAAHMGARFEGTDKASGERVIVKRIERAGNGEARKHMHEHVRIRVREAMANGPRMAGMARIDQAIAGAFGDMKWASKASVKDLGTREIDGIKAQGKIKSYEIPAGEIGNRNAIVVSAESWYSSDLQVTLMTKRSDPRTGERTWRMSNIKRDEPAPALFVVPSDYVVKDVMAQLRKADKK